MKKFFKKTIIILLILFFTKPIIYADDDIVEDNFSFEDVTIETANVADSEPIINARHAIVFDRNSKNAIYGKKETEICKMASTTKIMTTIVILENANLNEIVKVSKKAAGTGGSRLGLSTNDELSVESLLYGLMLKSGNDAAVALAEHVGGNLENFALMMNKKAQELNLQNTHFVTPHGLDNDEHYTTAFDLALLTDYALKNETFAKIVKTKTCTILINNQPKTISNTNELLGNFEGIYGVKTGFTNGANRCLVTSCKRNDLDFICVILGCDTKKDRTRDSVKLLDYSFKNYSVVNLKNIAVSEFNQWAESHSDSFYINKGKSQNLQLYLDENDFTFSNIALKNSQKDNIDVEINFNSHFDAPLNQHTKIGNLVLRVNNCEYYSIDIFNKNEILKKDVFYYISFIFKNYCNFFVTTQS